MFSTLLHLRKYLFQVPIQGKPRRPTKNLRSRRAPTTLGFAWSRPRGVKGSTPLPKQKRIQCDTLRPMCTPPRETQSPSALPIIKATPRLSSPTPT